MKPVRISAMNRRAFIGSLVGGVATATAVRTWPFRVFSFPSKIVIPSHRFSFLEMFALNGPEMAEFLPAEFDMDLDTFMRLQRPWPWAKPLAVSKSMSDRDSGPLLNWSPQFRIEMRLG